MTTTDMFKATLFIALQNRKQSKCPVTREWINTVSVVYPYNEILLINEMKNGKLLHHTATLMYLSSIDESQKHGVREGGQ